MYPDDAVALNRLAWGLAANARAGLRDGPEAIRLASRAVELTGFRQPVFIGTLAAAYAEAGRFSEAFEMAQSAHDLAVLTGQPEVAAANQKFLERFFMGLAVEATSSP